MEVRYRDKRYHLPDFLVPGAPKSGTSSLYFYLDQHPEVFVPDRKEIWFFSFMDSPPPYKLAGVVSEYNEYAGLFSGADQGMTIGEFSSSYLYTHMTSIKNIQKVYGPKAKQLKIIILLRNPVTRAWSQFSMERMSNRETIENFEEAIRPEVISAKLENNCTIYHDYIGMGMYYNQVSAYLDKFPSVKVVLADDLKDNTIDTLKDILKFLEVDDDFTPAAATKYNISGKIRSPWLHKYLFLKQHPLKSLFKYFVPLKLRQKLKNKIYHLNIQRSEIPGHMVDHLKEIFADDIRKLEDLIGRDLSHWYQI